MPTVVVLSANIVWRARIQWRKKVALGLICSLTVILVIVAIIRITIWSVGAFGDYSWLILLNSIEMTLGISSLLPKTSSLVPCELLIADLPPSYNHRMRRLLS